MRCMGVALMIVLATGVLVVPRTAGAAGSCKADGESCRTNQSCCTGKCINGAPPGAKPFGVCCTPTTCAAEDAGCGSVANGTCPQPLDCGHCTAPDTCGGGGTPNTCGCTPTTCTAQNAECGSIPDGCGGTLNCGTCTAPAICGGDGTPNVCGGDTPCETTADCISTRKCIRGTCQPKLTNQRPCFDALDCLSGCCCNAGAGICTLHTDTILYPIPGLCSDAEDCPINGDDQCPLAFAPEREILECH